MTDTPPGSPRLLRSLLLIAAALSVGGAIAYGLYELRTEPPRRESPTPAPLVESKVLRARDVTERFAGYGTARPDRTANVAAEVSAKVIELVGGIEAGSVVEAGQPLIRLDDREYRHALDRAKALALADQAACEELAAEAQTLQVLIATADKEVRVADDERDRLSRLFENGMAAKKECDFANLAYQQARRVLQGYEMEIAKNVPRQARYAASQRSREAEARLAELNVRRCEIVAPIGGKIDELRVDVGDHVAPGVVLVTLLDARQVEIAVQLPAAVHDRVKLGAPVRLACESMQGIQWQGVVARTAASVDEQARTFAAFVEVDNAAQTVPLVPGAFVRAEVQGPIHRNRITVPRDSIRSGRVLLVEGEVAAVRPVVVERFIGDRALVSGNLHDGDRLILSHLDRLAAGSRIRIRTDRPAEHDENGADTDETP